MTNSRIAYGIDLIGIFVLQSFPGHVLVRFFQHAPQKGKLSLKVSHHGVVSAGEDPGNVFILYQKTAILANGPMPSRQNACRVCRLLAAH